MQTWSMRKPIVEAIPPDRILMLDLNSNRGNQKESCYGRPWISGVLHNFGGRVFMGGTLERYLNMAPKSSTGSGASTLAGIGLFPEAIEQNPIIYDAVSGNAWRNGVTDVHQWLAGYLLARYGKEVAPASQAWNILLATLYSANAERGSMESVICSQPALKLNQAAPNAGFKRDYDPVKVWDAWALLQQAAPELGSTDTYRYDLVNLARQGLADLSIPLQRDIAIAYRAQNSQGLKESSQRFLDLAADMDRLLGTRKEFLLGKWLKDARAWGVNDAEKDQYEWNARLLVTVWGPSAPNALLFDYSNRQWSGLISGYYIPRWKQFLDYLSAQPSGSERFDDSKLHKSFNRPADDANDFYKRLSQWEQDWCRQHENYPDQPQGDSVAISAELLAKWRTVADEAFKRFNIRTMEFGASGDAEIYNGK